MIAYKSGAVGATYQQSPSSHLTVVGVTKIDRDMDIQRKTWWERFMLLITLLNSTS